MFPLLSKRTANVKKAVADIVSGKMFDWGVLCSTESGVIVDSPIKQEVIDEFRKLKAYFLNPDEKEKLSRAMFDTKGVINPDLVGKAPAFIAHAAGFEVPPETSCLIAELPAIGREYPLSREKLSPVLSMFTADGWREGCERCIQMLEFGGLGHTMAIHCSDRDIVMKFALEKPACRILVNTQAALGAVGYTNELLPSMTLGPGTFGRSIISENVSAKHLINIKRLAFETRPINAAEEGEVRREMGKEHEAVSRQYSDGAGVKSDGASRTGTRSWMEEIEERIRLKAGNQPLHPRPHDEGTAHKEERNETKYGSAMTIDDVERVMKNFQK